MRALILVAALGLAACGKNDQAGNTAAVDGNLAAETIAANDVTAIDAVTGEAANMAADVNFTAEAEGNLSGNASAPAQGNRPAPARRPASTESTTPATSNAATTATATNNTAE